MAIRTFQPGDDVAQVSIYNEAAGELPKFKPATLDEVRRRCRSADFDPSARFYAVPDGVSGSRAVGYVAFQLNGRVSFPWCRKGYEDQAEPLFESMLQAMRERGMHQAFAAYRGDWPAQRDFFLAHGFRQTREMINYLMDLNQMPTPAARAGTAITSLTPDDVPVVAEMGAGVLRTTDPRQLEPLLFRNPYYPPDSLFALRKRSEGRPVAVGIVVTNPDYANPKQLDAGMPCFRLGAFGTEGMTLKRINGLFSFLTSNPNEAHPHALDLLSYACVAVEATNVETFAAQVPSDAEHLNRFYKHLFRRQGSFPIFEREL
jgi:hypothetical protein